LTVGDHRRRDVNIFYGVQEIPQLYADVFNDPRLLRLSRNNADAIMIADLSVLINPVDSRKTC
jgi:glutamine cyclotransferase